MTNAIRLGVNIDHVATLRQARGTRYPDVCEAASMALDAGANSITVHLREDRRHIQDADILRLLAMPGLEMNLELAVAEDIVAIAEHAQPQHACLVPERRAELTTEGGLDVVAAQASITRVCTRLSAAGVVPALFIDPEPDQILAAVATGAHAVELHTGAYADAADQALRAQELARIQTAAEQAAGLGLEVHAGHGLHIDNVAPIAAVEAIVELNIGHALIARAVFIGLRAAVREMRERMQRARSKQP